MRRREVIFSLLLAVVFLLAAGFFFFTSPFFLTRLLVPWISRAAECPIAVERAEFRPFSRRLILHNFRLGRADKPFLTVRRARGTAQFGNLIRGIIDFADVELYGAELNICRDASGRWCQYELGYDPVEPAAEAAVSTAEPSAGTAVAQVVPQNEPAGSSVENAGSCPVQVRLARSRVEDSRINVIVRDRQRDFSWSFTGLSGEVTDFRNRGTVMVRCASPFQFIGRDGIDFSGRAEWNGELLLDEEMVFSGMRGGFVLGALAGNVDGYKISGGLVRCFTDVFQEKNQWIFRKFRLSQEDMHRTGSLVEFSGFAESDSGKYQLDFQRFLLVGPLLSLLADMKCGIRPGDMRVDGSGSMTGDQGRFSADLVCQVGRKAGPAYFGTEKVVLPDFQLNTEQNIHFDMRTGKADFRKALVQISSGGRQILAVSKIPEDGSVKAGIDGFDLKLLQLLMPDAQQFGIMDGLLSGTVRVIPGEKSAMQTCEADLRFTRTAFRAGGWQPEAFDASVAGKIILPAAGGPVQVTDLQMDFSGRNGQWLKGAVNGTVPLNGSGADLSWRASGDMDRMLSALRFPGSADVKKVLKYFSPAGFDIAGKGIFVPGGVKLRKHDLTVRGRGKSELKLSSSPRMLKWAAPADGAWHLRWQAALPAELLPPIPQAVFSSGRYSGKGSIDIPGSSGEFSIRGEADWQDLAGTVCGFQLPRISGGADFSFLRDRKGNYILNRSSFYCRTEGKPSLRLEGSGNADPAAGVFLADLRVRYLNEHLLNHFLPFRIRSGQFSGRSRISGDYRKMNWSANGYFAVDKLRTPGASRPVDGNLQYTVERNENAWNMPQCTLSLTSGGRSLADLRMRLNVPENADLPVKIQLSGSPVDLSSLYDHIGPAGKNSPQTASAAAAVAAPVPEAASAPAVSVPAGPPAAAAAPAAADRVILQTGRRAKDVDLDFRDMSWGSSQCFALKGNLQLRRNRVIGKNIIIDGGHGQLAWSFDGMDFPTGMMLAIHGKVLKPLDIGPFVSLFFPGSGLNGVVDSGEWNLNFRRLFTSYWGEDLSGSCKLKFRDVDLPVHAANGPLSRLLLLPVETIVRAEQLIPATWDVRKHFEVLWKHKFSAQSPFSRLKFHTGELHVGIDCGELLIRQMSFAGEPVSKMDVDGKMRLTAPYELEFNTNMLLCGVQAKLPVRGVLNSPQVAAWQVLAQMPGQTLAGWMDIFSPFRESGSGSGIPFISPFIRLLRDVAGFQK